MSSTLTSIQPEKLEAGLKGAKVPTAPPVLDPEAEPAGLVASTVGAAVRAVSGAFRRHAPVQCNGIPHGAVDVPIRIRRVRICQNGKGIAYCETHSYEALVPVPEGDGFPYPNNAETTCECSVPNDGYYDAEACVTVNGAMSVRLKKLTPVSV